ncbi:superoxide dismutase [Fe], putative [Plasmodium relictum]|uniref:Superoxide dismutase [Fe] n=1 Tax=Plasmodium relictum TaxID=85471 RepID=A0A1J1H7H5_PLARL|nr:superoxide dismutase [Fe], putative [Plasmodium relictum]CRH00903.1 superoxide dismutase [Fe], putative [Plasmodium relictum]
MNFNIFIYFIYILFLVEHKYFKGAHGLKHISKLNYINFNRFHNYKNGRCFSKAYESLYDSWGITPLWNTKPFSLIKLPFNIVNMSPFLSEESIKYHYSKHHATYVKNLNTEQHNELKNLTLEDIIIKYKGSIYNNAAQIFNHNFFWMGLKEEGGGDPYGEIKKKIDESFNSFENFKDIFLKEASGHFGSGWIWLIIKDKKLKIYQGHDADNPLKDNVGNPILTLDIWEHAYYVDYKNSRVEYIKEWFNKINWDFANYNLSILS